MLQQTQVSTVIPYFERWMQRFPTVEALAGAEEGEVLHAWQGLGYYSRARNLLRGAREVVGRFGGRVPDEPSELLTLPGIGRYTAGAIASIAYNRPAPILDGNVIRVLTRLFALRGDPRKAPLQNRLWELAELLIPEGHAREFNPALMELGATVCTPARPRCGDCSVAAACEARALGVQEELPEMPAGPQITPVAMAAALVREGDRFLLVQRAENASRWAGMWEFPNSEVGERESSPQAACRAVRDAAGLRVECGARATLIRHSVTRFRITLEVYHCMLAAESVVEAGRGPADRADRTEESRRWEWVSPAGLAEYPLPAAHRKIADRIIGQVEGEAQGELDFGG